MYYSYDLIQEIIMKTSIINVISEYTTLQRLDGTEYCIGLCPFHKESTPSLYVNYKTKTWVCHGCKKGGNVINFIMHAKKCSYIKAVDFLAKRLKTIDLPDAKITVNSKKIEQKKDKILAINKDAGLFYYRQLYNKRGSAGMAYFNKRKLSEETIKKFGLGYALNYGDTLYKFLIKRGHNEKDIKNAGLIGINKKGEIYDKFWNRVMYPIMNQDNKIIGFGGRVLDDSKPKYLNSPETIAFNKSENLYGLNLARYTDRSYFICCEGYMDVIAMHQAGFTNAVASLGTALTKQQTEIIASYVDTVYLAYDSDGPGVKAGRRAIELFNEVGITTKVIKMNPVKDPDEFIKKFGVKAFEERIENAESSDRFLIQSKRMMTEESESDPSEFYNYAAEILLNQL